MSVITTIFDGEIGSSVRTKLNHLIEYHNSGEGTLSETVALRMQSRPGGLNITRSHYNATAQATYNYGAFGVWKPTFLRGDATRWNVSTGAFTPNKTGFYLFVLPSIPMNNFSRIGSASDISGIGIKIADPGIAGVFYKMISIPNIINSVVDATRADAPATTYAIKLTSGVPVYMGFSLVGSATSSSINHSAYPHFVGNMVNAWGTTNMNLDISILFMGEA
jgi:hypothetical protein